AEVSQNTRKTEKYSLTWHNTLREDAKKRRVLTSCEHPASPYLTFRVKVNSRRAEEPVKTLSAHPEFTRT
ncbi:hypothetical protein, partial [uncultured Rothia sp.]|uniref:hypothetical protein n=1 Tax=uncultured Rothia sp. TaxID=316088 RepID=UPI0025E856DB